MNNNNINNKNKNTQMALERNTNSIHCILIIKTMPSNSRVREMLSSHVSKFLNEAKMFHERNGYNSFRK